MRSRRQISRSCAAAVLALALLIPAWAGAQALPAAPTAQALFPALNTTAASRAAPTFTIGYGGADGDAPDGLPVKVRFIYKPARVEVGGNWIDISLPYYYDQYYEQLVPWDDPAWSEWMDFPADAAQRQVHFADQADGYYVFGVQTMDADGAVSTDRRYGLEVANLQVRADFFRPAVALSEYYMGTITTTSWTTEIAAGQPLNFSWSASAEAYGGTIVSYQYGWNVIDPDDANDPGWIGPPGLETSAPERTFQQGYNNFTLKVVDDSGQATVVQWMLSVVPFIPYYQQSELLLIDQTVDANVLSWPSETGVPLDDQAYRNAFWQFLAESSGGVNGFDWSLDRFDHTQQVTFADLVAYKSVLCYAKASVQQLLFSKFRPRDGQDQFVWLTPYVERGGNLMLVGAGSMDSFLEIGPAYMTPIIFDTDESTADFGGNTFTVGFGTTELPDGSVVARGPRQFPYAGAGLATLDWTSSSTKWIYARTNVMRYDRVVDCAGLKALVKDDDFANHWGVTADDFPDTVATEGTIDWQDAYYDANDGSIPVVSNTFPFRDDEFVDANLSSRTTPWQPQDCADANAPNGQCVEPMLRGQSRLDWLREYYRSKGDADWPASQYTATEMDAMCGPLALTAYEDQPKGTAVTNGQVYGWLSYKMTADKPSGAPDIYWGFDPYRFDHVQSKKMIRWALSQVFRLNLNP